MVSSPLSFAKSLFAPSPPRAGNANRASSELSAASGKGPDFASHFAPREHELRSTAQKPGTTESSAQTAASASAQSGTERTSSEQTQDGSEANPGSQAVESADNSAAEGQTDKQQESEPRSAEGDTTEQPEENIESSDPDRTESPVLNPDAAAKSREAGTAAQGSTPDVEESASQQGTAEVKGKERSRAGASSTTSLAHGEVGNADDGSPRAADEKPAAPVVAAKPAPQNNQQDEPARSQQTRQPIRRPIQNSAPVTIAKIQSGVPMQSHHRSPMTPPPLKRVARPRSQAS